MNELRVVVSGAGKMGRMVAAALNGADGFVPVAYIDGLATVGKLDHLPVYTDPALCFAEKEPQVVVDFTNAAWTPVLVEAAFAAGVRLVIGTTGLDPEFVAQLRERAKEQRLGVVLASNFSTGAVLMMHFAMQAARFFDAVEIIELHHDQKVDSPSGTAKTTAELIRKARGEDFRHVVSERESVVGARGAELGGVAIHSVRLPGFVASQEVIFGGPGQTLTIRHDSTRESYMPGILAATREVMRLEQMIEGLETLLGLTRE